MRSKVTLESVTCDLEVRERQNSCATVSKNICDSTGTSLSIRALLFDGGVKLFMRLPKCSVLAQQLF
jgi:hypothetical protein